MLSILLSRPYLALLSTLIILAPALLGAEELTPDANDLLPPRQIPVETVFIPVESNHTPDSQVGNNRRDTDDDRSLEVAQQLIEHAVIETNQHLVEPANPTDNEPLKQQQVTQNHKNTLWDTVFDRSKIESSFNILYERPANAINSGLASLEQVKNRILNPYTGRYHDLAPIVSHPQWIQAMQLLSEGKCKESLEMAESIYGNFDSHKSHQPAMHYIFGRLYLCANQPERGKAILTELLNHPHHGIVELAHRALGLRLPVATPTDDDDAGMALSNRLNRARAAARNGEVDATLESLQALRGQVSTSWDRYRIRMEEARILEKAGRIDEASEVYLAIYRMTRSWRASNRIAGDIENAEKRLRRSFIPFGDRVDRMRELIERGRYTHARQISVENAKIRGVSGTEIRGWSLYRQALQTERERNRQKAAELFEQAEKMIKDPAIRPRLYHGWALALRRLDRDREAIALYERLCEEYPQNTLCDNALYEAGRLLQYLNEHDKAVEKFFLVAALYPFSEHVPDALWRAALSSYLQGQYDNTIAPLKELIAHYGEQKDASELPIGLKARYWLGVSYLKSGNKALAAKWLQNTINHGPLTWYGRLAVARMNEAGIQPIVRIPRSTITASDLRKLTDLRLPYSSRMASSEILAQLQLWPEAMEEVRRQLAIHPVPDEAHRLRAAIHLVNNEPNWAHWIMKNHIDLRGPVHASLRDWGTAFPLDYMELSHHYGNMFGVSPFLVQAIIRQESGFRPEVSSPAGAMGLMQVTPGTARYTARVFFDENRVSRRDILNPDTNVRLGTMYIRVHTAHAAEAIPLALAGYNAGPAPLKSWFERYGDRELDAWVESITYRETRGYVRKVMTSYISYAALYGDGQLPNISLQMPDSLRPWGWIPEDLRS